MKLIFTSLLVFLLSQSMSESYCQKPIISFGIIADVQYCNCDAAGSRYYRLSADRLSEALDDFKNNSVDFIINLGDLIDHGYESYAPLLKTFESSGLKVYHVRGNHDYAVDDKYKKRLPLVMPGNKGYYSFPAHNFRFIILDGNEISTYATTNKNAIKNAETYISKLKGSGSRNAINWNGGIGHKQLSWLKEELDQALQNNEKVMIFCHFPVYPDDIHNLLNYNDIIQVISNYHNIIAWFAGHNHSGNYSNFNMIHFVTLKGMVETEKSNSYSVVRVYENKVWINGSGREGTRILAY
jgi:manganese-dependent ADP-ribose/CDP-alcohol diphosphatase